jgi:hypothetical protein
MKRIFSIVILGLIIFSCESKQDEQGYWTIHFDEVKDSSIYPEELYFKKDTLIIQSSHYFKQVANYKKKNDTIYLIFKNGIEKKYPVSIISDSIIEFAKMKFIRTNEDNLSKTEPYELTGYQSKSRFIPHSNSTIIHLIKNNSEAKVILNDKISDLSSIPEFLNYGRYSKPKLYLYLGREIEINDLLKTYCWILLCEIYKVVLITHSESFEDFYTVKDYLYVEDSLFMNFIKENKIPQSGLLHTLNTDSEYVREKIKYFQNESNHSSMIDYLKFTEHLNFRSKVN